LRASVAYGALDGPGDFTKDAMRFVLSVVVGLFVYVWCECGVRVQGWWDCDAPVAYGALNGSGDLTKDAI